MCPVKWSRIFNQIVKKIVEGLTVNIEVLNIATVEAKACKIFPDVSFTFVWFEIFQVCNSFCDGLDSCWRYNVTKNYNFRKKGIVLVDDRENLILVLKLHYCIVDLSYCLFFLDERIEMNRH